MFLSLLAYAILRVAAGATLIVLATQHMKQIKAQIPNGRRIYTAVASAELVAGVFLTIGLWTQAAALAAALIAALSFLYRGKVNSLPSPAFYVLLIAVCASLFITGAGAFAFDVPF